MTGVPVNGQSPKCLLYNGKPPYHVCSILFSAASRHFDGHVPSLGANELYVLLDCQPLLMATALPATWYTMANGKFMAIGLQHRV